MANSKAGKRTAKQAKPTEGHTDDGTSRIKQVSKGSSQIVKDAAALLDDEMAAGILAAKQMQQRFQKERRINPDDFKGALQKFQGHAHEIVNQLNDKFSEVGAKENAELVRRLVNNSNSLLDLAVELVNTGAELADQLAQANLPKKK